MKDNTTPAAVQDMTTPAIERELARIPVMMPLPCTVEEFNEYQQKSARRRALRSELDQRLEDAA